MAFAKFEKPITDAAGNVMPNVQVTVRRETPGAPLAVLYADAGGTTPLSNPHVFSDGVARFYTAGALGGLRLDAVAAGNARTWRNEACGTGAQVDADTLLGAAFSMAFEPETSAPPGTGGIRADNADLSAATELFVSKVNTAGSSIAGRIGAIVAGDVLLLTASDGTQASWTASGVTDEDTHFTVGVSGHDGETALEAGPVALMLSRVGAPSTVPGPPGPSGKRLDLSVDFEGKPMAGRPVARKVITVPVTFPDDFDGSVFLVGVAATSEAVFSIEVNSSEVGTITVGAAQTEGVFATDGPVALEVGDVLEIWPPDPADATLSDILASLLTDLVGGDELQASEITVDPAVAGGSNAQDALEGLATALSTHANATDNPHSTTKTQVGLSNVTNDAQLKIASNLSDLANVLTARTNLKIVVIEESAYDALDPPDADTIYIVIEDT